MIPKGDGHCFPPSYGRGSAAGLLEAWSAGVGSRLRPGKRLRLNARNPAPPPWVFQFLRWTRRTESGCGALTRSFPRLRADTSSSIPQGLLGPELIPGHCAILCKRFCFPLSLSLQL